jgi:hypothetical protein
LLRPETAVEDDGQDCKNQVRHVFRQQGETIPDMQDFHQFAALKSKFLSLTAHKQYNCQVKEISLT